MKRKDIDVQLLNDLARIALKLTELSENYKLSDDIIHRLNISSLDIAQIRNDITK